MKLPRHAQSVLVWLARNVVLGLVLAVSGGLISAWIVTVLS